MFHSVPVSPALGGDWHHKENTTTLLETNKVQTTYMLLVVTEGNILTIIYGQAINSSDMDLSLYAWERQ
jgi:hypothetical protein